MWHIFLYPERATEIKLFLNDMNYAHLNVTVKGQMNLYHQACSCLNKSLSVTVVFIKSGL
jgi:hypothetical protein